MDATPDFWNGGVFSHAGPVCLTRECEEAGAFGVPLVVVGTSSIAAYPMVHLCTDFLMNASVPTALAPPFMRASDRILFSN